MNQNINPKSLKGKDVFSRTLDLMNKLTPINESVINNSLEFVKRGPNELTYAIIRENRKYFIKSTKKTEFKVSELGYIGGLKNKMDESYSSYEEALKHLNMKFQQLNESYGIRGGYNLFEADEVESEEVDTDQEGVKDKKYKLKINADSTESDVPPSDMGQMPTGDEMSPSGEMESPEISEVPAAEGGEMEMGDEMEIGGEETEGGEEGEMEMGGEETEGGEEDEEDLDFDIDEDEDPKKYIQKLTGRLGQKLRELSEVDPKLEKYVINSIISALHIDKMDKKDRIDIMKKFKRKKGMESVMSESYEMDEYYGMTSLDGPFNFEKHKSFGSDENVMRNKSMRRKPLRFKKHELDMDADEQWQIPVATAIGSAVGSYFAGKDESMDEELHGKQHKLDLNRNGRLDREDFKMLRSKKRGSSDESDEMSIRKKKLANALERIRNKRRSADERFGAFDDVKFRSTKDEYFKSGDGDGGTKIADPDIEVDEPLTPPKPRYPDPFNPEVPETYPQPKAMGDFDWEEEMRRGREEEGWKEKGQTHWEEQKKRRDDLERLKKDWEKDKEEEERYKELMVPSDENFMFGDGDGDGGTKIADPDIEVDEPLTPPKPRYPDPFNPEVPETYPQPKAEKKYKKDLTLENIIKKYRVKK